MKKYTFSFHYNKPESKKAGRPRLTVHWQNVCHIVDEVICNVPTHTKENKRQPRCVMTGKASYVFVGMYLNGKWFATIN